MRSAPGVHKRESAEGLSATLLCWAHLPWVQLSLTSWPAWTKKSWICVIHKYINWLNCFDYVDFMRAVSASIKTNQKFWLRFDGTRTVKCIQETYLNYLQTVEHVTLQARRTKYQWIFNRANKQLKLPSIIDSPTLKGQHCQVDFQLADSTLCGHQKLQFYSETEYQPKKNKTKKPKYVT